VLTYKRLILLERRALRRGRLLPKRQFFSTNEAISTFDPDPDLLQNCTPSAPIWPIPRSIYFSIFEIRMPLTQRLAMQFFFSNNVTQ
jgi:hypothetical protein